MFNTIKNSLKTPDVRKRLIYTLLLIVLFRLGCYITVPGVDSITLTKTMEEAASGIAGLVDLISGGAFSKLSIFAMTISPYITASIVVQLMTFVIPSWEKMTKEGGEEGRKKINRYTKLITIVLALLEAVGLYLTYKSSGIYIDDGFVTASIFVISLMAGTSLLMWLGEQITEKGIGNGISMIIFVGIISGLPRGLSTIWRLITEDGFNTTGLMLAIAILVGAIALVAGVVFVQEAERRIPVQYSKKVVGRKMVGANNTHIPLKLAMGGVMPIIFASSFMTFPAMIIQMINPSIQTQTGFWAAVFKLSIASSTNQVPLGYTIANAIIYLVLIVAFTFFYSYITFNPAEVSSSIKKNGGFIPGIRAGKPTTQYLSSVLTKILWFGGIYLALIAILPMMMRFTKLNLAFGGTSILIVVGVALETVQQLESQLVMRHYKGFLDK